VIPSGEHDSFLPGSPHPQGQVTSGGVRRRRTVSGGRDDDPEDGVGSVRQSRSSRFRGVTKHRRSGR
jgi:hypothetical protein